MKRFCTFCWAQGKSLRIWLHGAASMVIGGVSADIAAFLADHKDFSFTPENIQKLKTVALYGAALAVTGYFARSPLSTPTEKDECRKG